MKTTALLCAVALFGVLAPDAGFAEQRGHQGSTTTANKGGGHHGASHGNAAHGGGADAGPKDWGSADKGAKGNGPDVGNTSASPNTSATTQGSQNQAPNGHSPRWTGGADGEGRGANHSGATSNANGSGIGPAAKGSVGERTIDLVRPDDGYASLHRRAIRKSLIASAPKKSIIIPSGHLAALPRGTPLAAGSGAVRNAVGTASANGALGTPPHHHPPGFMAHSVPGVPGIAATASTVATVSDPHTAASHPADPTVHTALAGSGVNGSNLGHLVVGPGTVGGPAKLATGVNGSSIRRRF